MQQSMTGFGNDERMVTDLIIKTEVKALNSKFLDFTCRVPRELATKEAELKTLVNEFLKRGKVMLSIEVELQEAANSVKVNDDLFKAYYEKFSTLANEVGSKSDTFSLAINAPEVMQPAAIESDHLSWEEVAGSVRQSLQQCVAFRQQEGNSLTEKLKEYIHSIAANLALIEPFDQKRTEKIRERLHDHLAELKDHQVDKNRYEQEIIYYLEKLDISEEKVRLKKHIDYFLEVIDSEPQAGKKLGFISQEIGREINTIGSKANDAEIQRHVVQMKDELEKIKEQLLNIL